MPKEISPNFYILVRFRCSSAEKISKYFTMLYNKSYQLMRLLWYFFMIFLYLIFLVIPTCFGLLPAHHQGYLQLLFMCYHLVHVVLCCLFACVCSADWFVVVTTVYYNEPVRRADARRQTTKHYMNQVVAHKQQLKIPLMMGW